jgi:histidine ammonia-lyase/tyrosine ammonia-lyase
MTATAADLSPRSATDAPDQRSDERRSRVLELPTVLDCDSLSAIARDPGVELRLTPAVAADLGRSRSGLERILATGTPIYGATTGFGPHVRYAADGDSYVQGSGLIAHLASGAGPLLTPTVVRTVMIVRANTLARGHSGVRAETVQALLRLLDRGLVPAVPELGSVGASGDLIPLAHVARLLTGEGPALAAEPFADVLGLMRPGAEALAAAGLSPTPLDARDALALVNGTSYSTALAALSGAGARQLLLRSGDLIGWLYSSLGARQQALDVRLHAVRAQNGQQRIAQVIRTEMSRHGPGQGMPPEHPERPLQEVYSLRCAPQVLGPALDLIDVARGLIDDELAGVNDNPVLVEDFGVEAGWSALHGGNFHAAAVASAADLITGALTQAAVLAERLIDVLMSPVTSRAPLLLATTPGAQSGLAGAQLTASAVLAEARHACAWASTMSVPTNAGNQDIVPMAPLAARTALAQVNRLATILAVLAVSIGQYQHLVGRGLADGFAVSPPAWLPASPGFDHDVETHSRIAAAQAYLLEAPPRAAP